MNTTHPIPKSRRARDLLTARLMDAKTSGMEGFHPDDVRDVVDLLCRWLASDAHAWGEAVDLAPGIVQVLMNGVDLQ